jgi:hypothetical protein
MGVIKGVAALLLVLIVWTTYLVSNPLGWYRLISAFVSLFVPSIRQSVIDGWYKDDVMINGWLGGKKRHSLSGRVGYHTIKFGKPHYRVMQWVINRLFWFQPNHCFISIDWALFSKTDRVNLIAKHITSLNKII